MHQCNKIITDSNALTRRYVKLISQYFIIASILYNTDKNLWTKAHEEYVFTKYYTVKITSDISHQSLEMMFVTTSKIYFSKRIGNECGSICYSEIRTSTTSSIHHYLPINDLIYRKEDNTKYTWNYEYKSAIYTKIVINPLLMYWWNHRSLRRMYKK